MSLPSIISNPDAGHFFLYAETAFHHEGDFDYLLRLVDAAAAAGADGIKFQVLLDPASAYSEDLPQFGAIRGWCFDESRWFEALQRAKNLGLQTVVMPLDNCSAAFAQKHETLVDAYEVHSVCFNERPLLSVLARSSLPVLLNIGGRRLEEIGHAVEMLSRQPVALVYGLQNFPTEPANVNLARIGGYLSLFGRCMGYADHTAATTPEVGTQLSCYAYLLGCRIFERHIALEPGNQRIDHQAAVPPEALRVMRQRLKEARAALGQSSILQETAFDEAYRKRQKQLVFVRDMQPGETLTGDLLAFMVSPTMSDFDQKDDLRLEGRRICRPVFRHQPVRFSDIGARGE
jgi:N,N'-diacetyllegionaminate synthase